VLTNVGHRFDEIESRVASPERASDKPAGTIRITATDYAAEHHPLSEAGEIHAEVPDIKVEVTVDYGLTDIVSQRYDAGVRNGEQVSKGMIAVRIGPDMRMAVVGTPSLFCEAAAAPEAADLTDHNCINLRLPTLRRAIRVGVFNAVAASLNVRVDGQLTFNGTFQMLNAALDGLGLAYVPEDLVQPHVARGRLRRVLEEWLPSVSRLPPVLPEPSPKLTGLFPARRGAALPISRNRTLDRSNGARTQ